MYRGLQETLSFVYRKFTLCVNPRNWYAGDNGSTVGVHSAALLQPVISSSAQKKSWCVKAHTHTYACA